MREPSDGERTDLPERGQNRASSSPGRRDIACPSNLATRRARGCSVCSDVSAPGMQPISILPSPVAYGRPASLPHSAPQTHRVPEDPGLRQEELLPSTTPNCVSGSPGPRPLAPLPPHASQVPLLQVGSPERSPGPEREGEMHKSLFKKKRKI